jgi:hypothetical protein
MENIFKELAEAGDLHSEDCCVNQEGAGECDGSVTDKDCCDNIKFIVSLIRKTIDFVSHDMKFDKEEQRKAAVEMYMGEYKGE